MNNKSETKTAEADLSWLKNDDPEIYHALRALDGDLDALRWLKHRGDGLFLFVEALTGAREAVDSLEAEPSAKLADLFDTIAHCDVDDWLNEKHPELHRVFAYVRGDDSALRGLKHKKVTYKRVAEVLREKFRQYRAEDDGAEAAPGGDGAAAIPEGAAADVGCLIGEMHLQNKEFHKAIEAFSRAIANDPTPDAYDGRARAYRALAVLDEHSAGELRARSAQPS
jgi:hypothetical protein